MTVSTYLGRSSTGIQLTKTTITIVRGSDTLRSSVILENAAGKCRLLTHTNIALFYPAKNRPLEPIELSEFAKETRLIAANSKAPQTDERCYEIVQVLDSDQISATMRQRLAEEVPTTLPESITYFIRHGDFARLAEIVRDKEGRILSQSSYHLKQVHLIINERLFDIPANYTVLFSEDADEFSRHLTNNEIAKPKRNKAIQ